MPVPQRDQVEDIQPAPQIIPEAHPTDQYAAPIIKPPPDNEMVRDISSALSQLNPKLQDFAGIKEYQFTKQDLLAGAALRTKNQGDWKKAVDSGQVPPGASPWFRMGYDRMDMEMQSQQYDAALKQAYQSSSARNSDDPQRLQDWVKGFQGRWLKNSGADKNPMFNQTAAPLMAKSEMHLQQIHAQDRINDYEVKSQDALGQLASGILGTRMERPDPAKDLQSIADQAYSHGMPGQQVSKIMTESVARQALAELDNSVLDHLKNVNGGSGPLSNTAYGKEVINSTRHEIWDRLNQQRSIEWTQREHMKTMAGEQGSQEAMARLAKDPTANVNDLVESTAAAGNPEAAKQIAAMPKQMQGYREDMPGVVADLQGKIISGAAKFQDIAQAAANGTISAGTVDVLSKNLEISKRHDDIIHDPELSRMTGSIQKVMVGGDLFGRTLDAKLMADVSNTQNVFMMSMVKWKEAHPEGDPRDMYKYANDLQETLLTSYKKSLSVTNKAQKAADDFAAKDSAQQPQPAPVVVPPKADEAPTASLPKFSSTDDLKAFASKLQSDPKERAKIESTGISVQDFINQQYKLVSTKAAAKGGASGTK